MSSWWGSGQGNKISEFQVAPLQIATTRIEGVRLIWLECCCCKDCTLNKWSTHNYRRESSYPAINKSLLTDNWVDHHKHIQPTRRSSGLRWRVNQVNEKNVLSKTESYLILSTNIKSAFEASHLVSSNQKSKYSMKTSVSANVNAGFALRLED